MTMTRRVVVVTDRTSWHASPPDIVWHATLDRFKRGDPIGRGPTEADAVCSLFIEIRNREEIEQP
jgi:hypothetical protein